MNIITQILNRDDWYITSRYGARIHPITKLPSWHKGIDIGTHQENCNIYGVEDGFVSASGVNKTDGEYIWVDYPRINKRAFHGHLLERYVRKNDRVTKNTILGKVGKSGRADGIHLHLGLQHLDTRSYFDFEKYDYSPLPKKKYIYLSKYVLGWRVYPMNKPTISKYAIGKLAPRKFGGLKYEILETLPNSVYVIETQTFGKVKIWAGRGTLHTIKEE